MGNPHIVPSKGIRVLVADSNQVQCELLAHALRRRAEFSVSSCRLEMQPILEMLEANPSDVVVLTTQSGKDSLQDLSLIRRLHLAQPSLFKVLLSDSYDREFVVNAFRSGVRGLFCLSEHPFRMVCKCIQCVFEGQVWANSEQLQFMIEALSQVPSLRTVNSLGRKLLTPREDQVVALVADGQSNREIAQELNLSEHTIKKYLFRIFEKIGISSRVELVLYALSHGENRPAEWIAGAPGN
jgi:DNA-binding NarL/FixJ family response regulator